MIDESGGAQMRRDGKPLPSLMPALYSHRLADIQRVGLMCGYAIAIHGSMQRDLDVIAVPWYEEARPMGSLVEALCRGLGCTLGPDPGTRQPHGRWSYTLMMGGACFMDLCVMERHSAPEAPVPSANRRNDD